MRKLFSPGVIVVLLLMANSCAQGSRNEVKVDHRDLCTEFVKLVDETYNFKPSKLTDAERDVKSKKMDMAMVWKPEPAAPSQPMSGPVGKEN
jgi:hypothetical protein